MTQEKKPNKREFIIKYEIINNNIKTSMKTERVTPQEALGLLEMAKAQILDNLKKGRKDLFHYSNKGDEDNGKNE